MLGMQGYVTQPLCASRLQHVPPNFRRRLAQKGGEVVGGKSKWAALSCSLCCMCWSSACGHHSFKYIIALSWVVVDQSVWWTVLNNPSTQKRRGVVPFLSEQVFFFAAILAALVGSSRIKLETIT